MQSEDRLIDVDSENDSLIIDLVVQETVEELIQESLYIKGSMTQIMRRLIKKVQDGKKSKKVYR